MTKFDTLTVYVDFRFDAGASLPRDRCLRARIACFSADGFVYGPPITRKRLTSFPMLRTVCVSKLHDKCRRIVFEFSPIVPVSVYRECMTEVRLESERVA